MSQRPRIYLDHAATTPILPAAKAAMLDAMERWANPSSPHVEGRAARAALEDARVRIKRALGWDGELIFTSGATEAIEIAVNRTKLDRTIAYATEHDAIFRAAPDAAAISPPADDLQVPDNLTELVAGQPPALVAIQAVNSENGFTMMACTGKPHPIYELVHSAGGIVLRDFAQWSDCPRMDLAWGDLITISGHKIGAPPGVGALLVRDRALLTPTGGQEQGYRGGTENLPAILALAAAIEARQALYGSDGDMARVRAMSAFGDFLVENEADTFANRGGAWRSAHIHAVTMPRFSARTQLIRFDQLGFAVSAGSACSSGSLKPSRVLKAFGLPDEVAERTIRVSFGWSTTGEEIESFKEAWLAIAEDARKQGA